MMLCMRVDSCVAGKPLFLGDVCRDRGQSSSSRLADVDALVQPHGSCLFLAVVNPPYM